MDLASLLTWQMAVGAAVALGAGLMRGFSGFGSAMMMAPVFGILFGPPQTVAMVTLMEVAVTAQLMPGAARAAAWRFALPLALTASALVPFGSYILVTVDGEVMRRVIALVVLAFVLVMMRGWRYHGGRRLPTTLGVGAMGGVLWGATGMGGPPVLIYMLSGPDSATVNRANIIAYFGLTSFAVLLSLVVAGVVGADTLIRAGLLSIPFVAGSVAGSHAFRAANEALYRRVALYFLFAIALGALLV